MKEDYTPKLGDFYFGGLGRYEKRHEKALMQKEWKVEAVSELLGLYTAAVCVGGPIATIFFAIKGIKGLERLLGM